MRNLSELLNEALPLSKGKEYVNYSQGLYQVLYDDFFQGKNRVYFPLAAIPRGQVSGSIVFPIVERLLRQNGYKIVSYIDGLAQKVDDSKNSISIGKILRKIGAPSFIIEAYSEDPVLQHKDAATMSLSIVVSRHPYDIAGISSDRAWTSCMRLLDGNNGVYSFLLKNDVYYGSVVAYLIESSDTNIKRPLARILMKPYINRKYRMYYATDTNERLYGAWKNPKGEPPQFFAPTPSGIYSAGMNNQTLLAFYAKCQELAMNYLESKTKESDLNLEDYVLPFPFSYDYSLSGEPADKDMSLYVDDDPENFQSLADWKKIHHSKKLKDILTAGEHGDQGVDADIVHHTLVPTQSGFLPYKAVYYYDNIQFTIKLVYDTKLDSYKLGKNKNIFVFETASQEDPIDEASVFYGRIPTESIDEIESLVVTRTSGLGAILRSIPNHRILVSIVKQIDGKKRSAIYSIQNNNRAVVPVVFNPPLEQLIFGENSPNAIPIISTEYRETIMYHPMGSKTGLIRYVSPEAGSTVIYVTDVVVSPTQITVQLSLNSEEAEETKVDTPVYAPTTPDWDSLEDKDPP